MAGLVKTGLGAMGMDRAAGVAKAVSENPYGRAVTDIGAGLGLNKLFGKLFSGTAKSTLSTIEQEAAADAAKAADDVAERVAKESGGTVETAVKAVDEVVPPTVPTEVKNKSKGRTKSTKKTGAELEEEVLGHAEQFIQRGEEAGTPLPPELITKIRERYKALGSMVRSVMKVEDEAGGVGREVLRPEASSVVSLAGKAVGKTAPQSRVEVLLKRQITLREEAKESILDRAKDLGQVIDPETMAQLDARIAEARQALADILPVQKGRGRSGFIDSSVLMGTARAGIGAVAGAEAGSQIGDTPEERQRNAMLGALAGAGIVAGIPAIKLAAAQAESSRGL